MIIWKTKRNDYMNKKGFTLVELLAVIAILAILMLLIMPNVLNMFEKGRKDAFKVKVESIVRIAESQKQSDSLSNNTRNYYCYNIENICNSETKLDTTDTDAKYIVDFGPNGKVDFIAVEDSNYCYVNESYSSNINEEEFVKNGTLSCDNGECSCLGQSNTNGGNSPYVYWTKTEGGNNTEYAQGSYPSTAKTRLSDLSLTNGLVLIRTNKETVEHEACVYYNGKLACQKPNGWVSSDRTGSATLNKLIQNVESSLGITVDESLTSYDTSYVSLRIGDSENIYGGFWVYNYSAKTRVLQFSNSDHCDLYNDGIAACGPIETVYN